ncbi:MAG TPA: family 16 glycoside hydrolase [Acidobacteriota bacterium]|nr:family 16 glycoside hydrolase [Acidobacteriota bacterium]
MERVLLVFFAFAAAAFAGTQVINFDSASAGSVPVGWTVAMTHTGGAPKWEIRKDDSAPSKPNVFAQVSDDKTGGRFPLAIFDQASFTDGSLSVKFKTVSGSGDQAAGMVWRYKNPDNYYIVRANALEDNVVLYRVEGGKRISLAPKGTPSNTYGVKHRVPKNTWCTLKVTFQGKSFAVFFDGKQIFEVEDSTFTDAGKVGLWTKADSVTYFDDFQIESK